MKEMEEVPATLGKGPDAAAGTPSELGLDDVSPSTAKRSNASPIIALTCGYDSPLGHMTLAERDGSIVGAWFDGQRHDRAHLCVLSSRDEQNGHQFMSSLPARAEQAF